MMVSRICLTGLAVMGAVTFASAADAQSGCSCNVVPPEQVNQAQVITLGNAHPARDTLPDVGGSVTDVIRIFNQTSCRIVIRKVDDYFRNQTFAIEPGQASSVGIWVPWADDWNSPHRMHIRIGDRDYFQIWQKGSRIAFRTEPELARLRLAGRLRAEYDGAPSVPGYYASGGRRHLYIALTSDGRPYFKMVATNR